MRLFVLGATGRTGGAVLDHALRRGHHVTAFVRAPNKLSPHDNLRIVAGDPRNKVDLASALPGHDAVISALGPRGKNDGGLLAASASSLLAAIGNAGPKRLLIVSSALLFPVVPFPGSLLRRLFAAALSDSRAMEDIVSASDIEWTIMRPPRLTNGAATDKYRVCVNALPPGSFFGSHIARVDLGRALVDDAEAGAHVRELVGVSA